MLCTVHYSLTHRAIIELKLGCAVWWYFRCFISLERTIYSQIQLKMLLSHPSLEWLYVFSSFPPCPPPPPRPPLQQLLPLMSKPFELNLRYLAQRVHGSGEMYSMTFPWPWPKVTAVASISKNVLVRAIKWEPLIGSLQNMWALFP